MKSTALTRVSPFLAKLLTLSPNDITRLQQPLTSTDPFQHHSNAEAAAALARWQTTPPTTCIRGVTGYAKQLHCRRGGSSSNRSDNGGGGASTMVVESEGALRAFGPNLQQVVVLARRYRTEARRRRLSRQNTITQQQPPPSHHANDNDGAEDTALPATVDHLVLAMLIGLVDADAFLEALPSSASTSSSNRSSSSSSLTILHEMVLSTVFGGDRLTSSSSSSLTGSRRPYRREEERMRAALTMIAQALPWVGRLTSESLTVITAALLAQDETDTALLLCGRWLQASHNSNNSNSSSHNDHHGGGASAHTVHPHERFPLGDIDATGTATDEPSIVTTPLPSRVVVAAAQQAAQSVLQLLEAEFDETRDGTLADIESSSAEAEFDNAHLKKNNFIVQRACSFVLQISGGDCSQSTAPSFATIDDNNEKIREACAFLEAFCAEWLLFPPAALSLRRRQQPSLDLHASSSSQNDSCDDRWLLQAHGTGVLSSSDHYNLFPSPQEESYNSSRFAYEDSQEQQQERGHPHYTPVRVTPHAMLSAADEVVLMQWVVIGVLNARGSLPLLQRRYATLCGYGDHLAGVALRTALHAAIRSDVAAHTPWRVATRPEQLAAIAAAASADSLPMTGSVNTTFYEDAVAVEDQQFHTTETLVKIRELQQKIFNEIVLLSSVTRIIVSNVWSTMVRPVDANSHRRGGAGSSSSDPVNAASGADILARQVLGDVLRVILESTTSHSPATVATAMEANMARASGGTTTADGASTNTTKGRSAGLGLLFPHEVWPRLLTTPALQSAMGGDGRRGGSTATATSTSSEHSSFETTSSLQHALTSVEGHPNTRSNNGAPVQMAALAPRRVRYQSSILMEQHHLLGLDVMAAAVRLQREAGGARASPFAPPSLNAPLQQANVSAIAQLLHNDALVSSSHHQDSSSSVVPFGFRREAQSLFIRGALATVNQPESVSSSTINEPLSPRQPAATATGIAPLKRDVSKVNEHTAKDNHSHRKYDTVEEDDELDRRFITDVPPTLSTFRSQLELLRFATTRPPTSTGDKRHPWLFTCGTLDTPRGATAASHAEMVGWCDGDAGGREARSDGLSVRGDEGHRSHRDLFAGMHQLLYAHAHFLQQNQLRYAAVSIHFLKRFVALLAQVGVEACSLVEMVQKDLAAVDRSVQRHVWNHLLECAARAEDGPHALERILGSEDRPCHDSPASLLLPACSRQLNGVMDSIRRQAKGGGVRALQNSVLLAPPQHADASHNAAAAPPPLRPDEQMQVQLLATQSYLWCDPLVSTTGCRLLSSSSLASASRDGVSSVDVALASLLAAGNAPTLWWRFVVRNRIWESTRTTTEGTTPLRSNTSMQQHGGSSQTASGRLSLEVSHVLSLCFYGSFHTVSSPAGLLDDRNQKSSLPSRTEAGQRLRTCALVSHFVGDGGGIEESTSSRSSTLLSHHPFPRTRSFRAWSKIMLLAARSVKVECDEIRTSASTLLKIQPEQQEDRAAQLSASLADDDFFSADYSASGVEPVGGTARTDAFGGADEDVEEASEFGLFGDEEAFPGMDAASWDELDSSPPPASTTASAHDTTVSSASPSEGKHTGTSGVEAGFDTDHVFGATTANNETNEGANNTSDISGKGEEAPPLLPIDPHRPHQCLPLSEDELLNATTSAPLVDNLLRVDQFEDANAQMSGGEKEEKAGCGGDGQAAMAVVHIDALPLVALLWGIRPHTRPRDIVPDSLSATLRHELTATTFSKDTTESVCAEWLRRCQRWLTTHHHHTGGPGPQTPLTTAVDRWHLLYLYAKNMDPLMCLLVLCGGAHARNLHFEADVCTLPLYTSSASTTIPCAPVRTPSSPQLRNEEEEAAVNHAGGETVTIASLTLRIAHTSVLRLPKRTIIILSRMLNILGFRPHEMRRPFQSATSGVSKDCLRLPLAAVTVTVPSSGKDQPNADLSQQLSLGVKCGNEEQLMDLARRRVLAPFAAAEIIKVITHPCNRAALSALVHGVTVRGHKYANPEHKNTSKKKPSPRKGHDKKQGPSSSTLPTDNKEPLEEIVLYQRPPDDDVRAVFSTFLKQECDNDSSQHANHRIGAALDPFLPAPGDATAASAAAPVVIPSLQKSGVGTTAPMPTHPFHSHLYYSTEHIIKNIDTLPKESGVGAGGSRPNTKFNSPAEHGPGAGLFGAQGSSALQRELRRRLTSYRHIKHAAPADPSQHRHDNVSGDHANVPSALPAASLFLNPNGTSASSQLPEGVGYLFFDTYKRSVCGDHRH